MAGVALYFADSHWLIADLWSITCGSILTVFMIVLIRVFFGRFMSAKAKYLLWILLMLRLCVADLPESSLSLMNLEPIRASDYKVMIEEAREEGSDVIIDSRGDVQVLSALASEKEALPSPLLIWFCGTVICISYYVIVTVLSGLRLRQALDVTDEETLHTLVRIRGQLGITRDIRLCYGDQTLIGGLRRPIMMIPREMEGKKLEAALTHELMHYRCGDLWIIALQRALCCVHWFNPLVWLCFAWSRRDCELACDERVLQMNISEEIYAQLLYDEGSMKHWVQPGTTAFGRSDLKKRIKQVRRFKTPGMWMVILAVILALLVAATTLTSSAEPKTVERQMDTYSFFIHGDDHTLEFSEPGQQHVMKYSIKPPDSVIQWTTDDQSVATVDEYGVVTAVGPGRCVLTAVSGDITRQKEITCDFAVDISLLCPERDMLEYFFTIPNEEMFHGFAEKFENDSSETIKSILEQMFPGRYSVQFELSFLAGNNIGRLWHYAFERGFSVQISSITITKGMSSGDDYSAWITVKTSDGISQSLAVTGKITYDAMGRVNTITASGQDLLKFYRQFVEQEDVP